MSLRERTRPRHLLAPCQVFCTHCADSDAEVQSRLTNGGPSFFAMDEAFCARVFAAIEAGLESAPIGVVTTPGTKNPKYVPTEPRPLTSSQRDLEHA